MHTCSKASKMNIFKRRVGLVCMYWKLFFYLHFHYRIYILVAVGYGMGWTSWVSEVVVAIGYQFGFSCREVEGREIKNKVFSLGTFEINLFWNGFIPFLLMAGIKILTFLENWLSVHLLPPASGLSWTSWDGLVRPRHWESHMQQWRMRLFIRKGSETRL